MAASASIPIMLNKMANAYENTKILGAIVNSVSRDRSGNPHGNRRCLALRSTFHEVECSLRKTLSF
jgi:hypothetical protein